jgi:hypothetical protein
MEMIRDYISKSYLFCVGLFWISVHIYLRFFIIRLAYKLSTVGVALTLQYFIISVLFLIFHCIMLLLALYNIYTLFSKTSPKKSLILEKLKRGVEILYWDPLLFWHDLIAPNIPYSGEFLYSFGKYLWNQSANTKLAIAIIFDFIPRIIVATAFFIDIVVFNEIYYFIYAVHLIIIPILYKLFLKLFGSFIQRGLPDIEEVLKVTPGEEHNQYHFELQSDYREYDTTVLQDYTETWLWFTQLFKLYTWYQQVQTQYTSYIIVVTSSLYLSAGLYKLYLISFFSILSDIIL